MDDSKMKETKAIKNMKLPSSYVVALAGYKAMMSEKPVKIFGFVNNAVAFSIRLVPRKWVVAITRKLGA